MEVTVRKNDTVWYYSQLFDIPQILIENSNPHVIPTQLMIGQQINIPGYFLNAYSIKKGDKLWSIAISQNVPIDTLFLVNRFVDQYNMKIGQTIYIPKKVRDYIVADVDQYTYEKMCQDINQLVTTYPFLKKQTVGQSVMNKNLIEIQVGIGNKKVHADGSFHANEWITTPVLMQFLNQYALSLTTNMPIRGINMLPLYFDTELSLVPMVNPDGVDLVINGSSAAGQYQAEVLAINNQNQDFSNWKANINGVDLNNQFPALWEVEAARKPILPAPRDYPGPAPLTEPESIAMANLANTRNFQRINTFHTQGKVIYWGFERLESPISAVIAEEYARVSGYEAVRYVDSYAGYKDWFIQKYQKPGFTIELGIGNNPLSMAQFPAIYQEGLGILLANLYL